MLYVVHKANRFRLLERSNGERSQIWLLGGLFNQIQRKVAKGSVPDPLREPDKVPFNGRHLVDGFITLDRSKCVEC